MATRKNQLNYFCIIFTATLFIFTIIFRQLPHSANFAPLGALAVFSGAFFSTRYAFFIPLSAAMLSDLLIGMHSVVFYTWTSYIVITFISSYFLRRRNLVNILLASFSSSLIFFTVSNFGVWAEGRLYPATLEGLINCYYNAIPFFRNTFLSDLVFSSIFISVYLVLHGKYWRSYAKDKNISMV